MELWIRSQDKFDLDYQVKLMQKEISHSRQNKAIESGKEHRIQYGEKGTSYAKKVDPTCRNHGTCLWCLGNRTHKQRKSNQEIESKLKEYKEGI